MIFYLDGVKFKIKAKSKKFIELKTKKLFSKKQEQNLKETLGEHYSLINNLIAKSLQKEINHLEIHHIDREYEQVFYIDTGFFISLKNSNVDITLKNIKYGISNINSDWASDDNREHAKRIKRTIDELSSRYKSLGLF